MFKRKTN